MGMTSISGKGTESSMNQWLESGTCVARSHLRETRPENGVPDAFELEGTRLASKRPRVLPIAESKLVMLGVTAAHGDESVHDQPELQENLGDTDPEFDFTKPSYRVELEQGEEHETDRDSDGGVQSKGPVLDHDVECG